MDLECKYKGCSNVYKLEVSGEGRGFVGQIVVAWKCSVCGKWNVFLKGEFVGGKGLSVNLEW